MNANTVEVPFVLLQEMLENLYELRGERDWWGREPRAKYQAGWKALNAQIDTVEKLLANSTTNP